MKRAKPAVLRPRTAHDKTVTDKRRSTVGGNAAVGVLTAKAAVEKEVLETASADGGGTATLWVVTAPCCAGDSAGALVVRIAVWPGHSDGRCTLQLAVHAHRARLESPSCARPVRARRPSKRLADIPHNDRRPLAVGY